MEDFLPFALPKIGEEEIAEVCDSLRSGWLTTGPKVKRFESDFADFVGAKYALAVNSATAGLHLSLEALGIQAGDKVLTTIYTFTASAEVIRYMGAEPVFADIDPNTLNIDVQHATKLLAADSSIRAIIPVHIGGLACDMKSIHNLARDHTVSVVEDAAHAMPTEYGGYTIGGQGDLTVFSFYVTKPLAVGEGGMVTTNSRSFADRIGTMRLHGISKDVFDRYTTDKPSWYYEVVAPGFKYNMPDTAAALGIHQLAKARKFQARRSFISSCYSEAFGDLPIDLPADALPGDTHAWHLYIIRLKLEALSISRNRFIELMMEAGVGVSVHYIPLHLQPYWRDAFQLSPEDFPVAHAAYERVVSLPIYVSMSDRDINRVIDTVTKILRNAAK